MEFVIFLGDNRFARFQDAQDVEDFERKPKNTKRHVSFKPSGVVGRGGMKNRNFQLAIKARLEDDEEMADFGFSKANVSWCCLFWGNVHVGEIVLHASSPHQIPGKVQGERLYLFI